MTAFRRHFLNQPLYQYLYYTNMHQRFAYSQGRLRSSHKFWNHPCGIIYCVNTHNAQAVLLQFCSGILEERPLSFFFQFFFVSLRFFTMSGCYKICRECKIKITVLDDHLECNRHRVSNVVFLCEVCNTRADEKQAQIIERKKWETAKRSATVKSLATEIPSVGNIDSHPVSQTFSVGNEAELQSLSDVRQNGNNMT